MAEYAKSFSGSVGFGKQAAALTTLVAATHWQAVISESMKETRAGRKFASAIRRGQDPVLALKGLIATGGSISGPLVPDDYFQGRCIAALLGNNNAVSGAGTTGYIHVFDEPRVATTADWPTYGETIEINRGSDDNALLWQFIGTFLKSMTWTIPKDGEVTVTTEWVGCKSAQAGTYTTPVYSAKNPFEGWMADLKVGANYAGLASIDVEQITIKIDNGAAMKPSLNGRYPSGRTFGKNLTAEIEFEFALQESLTQFNKFAQETENTLQVTLTHDTLAGSSSGVYNMVWTFPRVIFTGDEPNLAAGDTIPQKMKAVAGYGSDGTNTCMVKITSTNSQTGVYTV